MHNTHRAVSSLSHQVLLVEDDIDLADLMSAWLLSKGIVTVVASDGLQAMEFLRQDDFTAVVCDLRMPGMDGVSLLRWLLQNRPHIERVVLSTYSGEIEMADGTPMALTARFQKPLDRVERERLLAVLRQRSLVDS